MTLFLIERGRLSEPLLHISSYIEQNKRAYYECLQRTRTHGDWIGWVRYVLEAIRVSASIAVRDAKALFQLRDALRSRVELAERPRELRLIDELFANPYVNVRRAREALNVSSVTASRSIDLLEKLGILKEQTGKSWGRTWVAEPIRVALDGSTES